MANYDTLGDILQNDGGTLRLTGSLLLDQKSDAAL